MKKLFFFLFTFIFSLSLFAFPVFANGQNQNVTLDENQTINGDYFANGNTVTILGTINGDSYTAGGTVSIDGKVNGDIIATGGTVTINGSAQNIRVAGGTVTINGTVAKNVTVLGGTITLGQNAKIAGSLVTAGGTINILSPIGKGATIGGGTVTINNTINGDVSAGVGQLTLEPKAKINGNLTYTSEQKAQITQGAVVTGSTNQKMPQKPQREVPQKVFLGLGVAALFLKLINMVSLLVIGLLLIGFAPHYVKRVANGIVSNPWLSLGIGVVALLVIPLIIFVLLLTIIGIPIAIILTVLFAILIYLTRLFVMYLIGEKIGQSINQHMPMWGMFIIGLIVYEVVVLIPIIGWLVDLAALLFGLGSLLVQKKNLYTSLRNDKAL